MATIIHLLQERKESSEWVDITTQWWWGLNAERARMIKIEDDEQGDE